MQDTFGSGRRSFADTPRRQPSIDGVYRPSIAARLNVVPQPEADAVALAIEPDWSHGNLPSPVGNFLNKGASDGGSEPPEPAGDTMPDNTPPNNQSRWQRLLAKLKSIKRPYWLAIGGTLVLVVAGSLTFAMTRPGPAPTTNVSQAKPKPAPPPAPPTSPLTGLQVSAEDAKHIVTGVMIENSINARPQTGLQQAGVVYEAIAEYGITRFLALYQESKPGNIGPIRSVRPYYIDWATSYDAPIAHVGGSPAALNKIKAEGVKDLDQFFNPGAYRRVSNRFAPHNVYSTMGQLNAIAKDKGWTSSNFKGWARKKDAASKTPSANRVDIAISGPTYNVHYDYDAASNTYKRIMAGQPHIDGDSQQQIAPKVVIGLATAYGLEADGYHSKYQVTGEGSAFVFQDGIATKVTWKRPDARSLYQFYDSTGKPFKLNAGQTWITVVGDPSAITFGQ